MGRDAVFAGRVQDRTGGLGASASADAKAATAAKSQGAPSGAGSSCPEIVFDPAYDGGLCNLDKSVWPVPVVFDISGFEPLQVLPIVRDHDQGQKIGQTEAVVYGPDGITARGRMLNLGIDEAAEKVLRLWKRGSELQASIHTDLIGEGDIEFVQEGESVTVNGREFAGPVEVVRKTRLREISIVTVGANAGTSVEIKANAPAQIKETRTMSKLLGKALTGVKERLNRAAKAADQPEDVQAEEDGFVQWLADNALNADELTEGTLGALKAMYAKASEGGEEEEAKAEDGEEPKEGAAEDGCGEPKDGEAEEDGEPKEGEAEEDEPKEGEASVGAPYRRKSAKTRNGEATMKKTYAGPSSGGPNAARIAEASLLISCGMRPEKLDRKNLGEHGFGQDELNEAVRGENRGLTPMGTLFRAGMCSGSNYKDFGHVSRVMNQAKFQSQMYSLRPGEYVTGSGRAAAAAGNLASVDIPTIMANVMYKSLLVGFKDVPDPTDELSKVVTAQDFRPQYFWTLDSNGNFEEVKENGELNVLKLSDTPYQNEVKLRGAECRYSYQMMINDDQNALSDIPQHMGRRFKIQKQQYWWGVLCGAISGSNFTAVTGNPAMSVQGLDAAFGQIASIYDANGEPIIASGKFVIGPTALGGTIRQIHTALDIVAAGGNSLSVLPNANVYANAFTPVVTPFLGGSSKNASVWGNAAWALLADPADLPAIIMGYLKGNSTPTMETKNGDFAVEGVRIGTWWGFGASLADTRGLLFSNGSGS